MRIIQGQDRGRAALAYPWLPLSLVILTTTLITGHGLAVLIFSSLGHPLQSITGILVLILHGCLMGAGLARLLPRYRQTLASGCTGAPLGFFYGWTYFGETLEAALVGIGVGVVVGVALSRWWRRGLGAIALRTAIACTTAGAVFLLGTTAIAGLFALHPWGLVFTILTLIHGGFTWQWTRELERMIRLEQETRQDNPENR